jgi:hypothetical protein
MAVTTEKSGERITLEQLRSGGTSDKAWVAIRGKVRKNDAEQIQVLK